MKRPLVLVRSSAHVGGIERFLLDLATYLAEKGWQVSLVFLHRPSGRGARHPAERLARARGLRAFSILDRGLWDLRPLLALYSYLTRTPPPPIVHTHDYKSDVLTALARPRYHIATAHGFTEMNRRQRLYKRLDLLVLRHLPLVIAPSAHQADELQRAGIAPACLRVIVPAPNWTRLMDEARRPLPSSAQSDASGGPIFSFVGRCSPERGGDLLLKAFAYLATEQPRARLWFLGDGPARRAWEALASQLGVASRVCFWGWREDVAAFIRHSTFVVNPTRAETLGLAAIEALGLGTPVIAAPVGGLRDLSTMAGILWAEGLEPAAWARAMSAGLAHAREWRARAHQDAPRVRAAFSLERAVRAHEEVYLEI